MPILYTPILYERTQVPLFDDLILMYAEIHEALRVQEEELPPNDFAVYMHQMPGEWDALLS